MASGQGSAEIAKMENHFESQAEGRLPFTQGFVLVGDMGNRSEVAVPPNKLDPSKGMKELAPKQGMVQTYQSTVRASQGYKRKRGEGKSWHKHKSHRKHRKGRRKKKSHSKRRGKSRRHRCRRHQHSGRKKRRSRKGKKRHSHTHRHSHRKCQSRDSGSSSKRRRTAEVF